MSTIQNTVSAGGTADASDVMPQYSLARILGTWAAAALPMAAAAWLVAPIIAGSLDGRSAWPRAIVAGLTLALAWQFVLVLWAVRRERGNLRWATLKDALWLHAPRSPRSGRRGGRVWLVVVPLIVLMAGREELPGLPVPMNRDLAQFLASPDGQSFFSGNWPWFAAIVTMMVFNTVLGEELLFRGLLLPRMNAVFGRWDWVANGVLFGLYHLHVPWAMPKAILGTFLYAYPTKRYRSALIGIAVHSAESVVFTALLLTLVLR